MLADGWFDVAVLKDPEFNIEEIEGEWLQPHVFR
jgi:hypothetical protein